MAGALRVTEGTVSFAVSVGSYRYTVAIRGKGARWSWKVSTWGSSDILLMSGKSKAWATAYRAAMRACDRLAGEAADKKVLDEDVFR